MEIERLPDLLQPGEPAIPAARLQPAGRRLNLAQVAWLRPLLESRWPQFLARSLALAGFVFVIVAGLFGSPVGNHNFAIIFVWIAWWTALKLVFIPLGGRSWCSICPIPMPGEWLQQGGLLKKYERRSGLNLRWPRRLGGGWLQWGGFLLIGLFSAVTLTDARVTAWVLLALFVLATVMSAVFERRSFCNHVCPIGGFTGIYARTAPLEVRVINSSVCAAHSEKTCYQGCPWGLYPLALRDSSQCGLCMECLRVCPSDNIAINLRPFGADLAAPRTTVRLDEAFLALMMLGAALAFSAVFTGPWGALKLAAFTIGSPAWMVYALGFLALNLVLLPGLFGLAVWVSQAGAKVKISAGAFKKSFAHQSQVLLPLGLAAWIAFTISFALPKLNYVLSVLSDPFGWGWNLFGTANTPWSPDVSAFSPALQVVLLLGGLVWAVRVSARLNEASRKTAPWAALPVPAFCLLFTLAMLWLLIG